MLNFFFGSMSALNLSQEETQTFFELLLERLISPLERFAAADLRRFFASFSAGCASMGRSFISRLCNFSVSARVGQPIRV